MIVLYGAIQQPDGRWIAYIEVNTKRRYFDANIKKSERGALTIAERFAKSLYPHATEYKKGTK